MRIERAKNAKNGIFTGIIQKIYQLFAPFLIRTILIRKLGMEYLGLNSLFTSLLHVLNLAELGVGTAMVFSMYKPIAEDDSETICDLMKIYQVYYRVIGLIVLVIGVSITPIIPKLIKSDIPTDVNIFVLYFLNLSATVVSYWLFAYKNSVLVAHQRNDIISIVTIIASTIMYLGQFLSVYCLQDYYVYLVFTLLGQVLINIGTAIASQRVFPQYSASKVFNKGLSIKINKRIHDLFIAKLGEVIVTSADSIVISSYLGLKLLASYNSYYYILSAIFGFILLGLQACLAGIGNSLIVEDQKKNLNDFKKVLLFTSWIAGMCSCCMLCLYQTFMKLWIGQDNILPMSCVSCFTVYFYVISINQLFTIFRDAAGMWRADRFRPIVTALTNLGLNLILVQYIGLYGVLLSTVISILIVGMPWIIHNLFTTVFSEGKKEVISRLLFFSIVSALSVIFSYGVCLLIPTVGIPAIAIRLFICVLVSNGLFLSVYRKLPEFKGLAVMADKLIGTKAKIIHKFLILLMK